MSQAQGEPSADTEPAAKPAPDARPRLLGVDTLRFLMALSVAIGHFGLHILLDGPGSAIAQAVRLCISNLGNGPAAVIVFFVISGLCIHFPARKTLQLDSISAFYTRRLLRIGIPFLAATGVYLVARVPLKEVEGGIFWSLYCEIIYYLLYPLLLHLRKRFGWERLIGVAFLAAAGVAMTAPFEGNYPAYGNYLTWILGLPVWLLGCLLAEKTDTLPSVGVRQITLWRLGIYACSLLPMILRWHLPGGVTIGYPWSLNLFSIPVFFWLRAELAYFRQHKPNPPLEAAGAWSYSLYLMHLMAGPLVYWMQPYLPESRWAAFAARIVVALLISYIFFVIVERPAHQIAVKASRREKKVVPA